MNGTQTTTGKQLEKGLWIAFWFPAILVVVLAGIWLFEVESGIRLRGLGVAPRDPKGLLGLLGMPLVHGDWKHLINNSFPLLILGAGIYYFYKKVFFRVLFWSWVFPGLAVWLIGQPGSVHIGASGIVYAFASFIFFSGIFRNHLKLIALSMVIVFFYGSMIWGIFPIVPTMSWEGHLGGGLIGLFLAWHYRKIGGLPKPIYSWDLEEEEEEEAEAVYPDGTPMANPNASPYPWDRLGGAQPTVRYLYVEKKANPEGEKPTSTNQKDPNESGPSL